MVEGGAEKAAGAKVEVGKAEAVAGKMATTATPGLAEPTVFLARKPLVPAQPDASSS
jgi:hypothetical protein